MIQSLLQAAREPGKKKKESSSNGQGRKERKRIGGSVSFRRETADDQVALDGRRGDQRSRAAPLRTGRGGTEKKGNGRGKMKKKK